MVTVTIKTTSKQSIYFALYLQELAKTDLSVIQYSGATEAELLAELDKFKEKK